MRNFHANSHVDILSYTINGGEYVSPDIHIREVLGKLSIAFETPLGDLCDCWDSEVLVNKPYSKEITPSEYEVLQGLYDFYIWVTNSIITDGRDTQSRVFSYHNLNTGKSVVWSHLVC